PPSPPAEKATARQDQAGQSSTGNGGGNSGDTFPGQANGRELDRTAIGKRRCNRKHFVVKASSLGGESEVNRARGYSNARLCRELRGRDGSVREELAEGVTEPLQSAKTSQFLADQQQKHSDNHHHHNESTDDERHYPIPTLDGFRSSTFLRCSDAQPE